MATAKRNFIVKTTAKPAPAKEVKEPYKLDIPQMDINFDPVQKEITFNDIMWFIHGIWHCGKTSLFTKFENAFFISFDAPNYTLKYRSQYATTYEQVLAIVDAIIQRKKTVGDIQHVIFDNVRLYGKVVEEFTCKQLGIKMLGGSKKEYRGGDWKQNDGNMLVPVRQLLGHGIMVHGITHTKKDTIDTVEGKESNVFVPNAGTQGNGLFCQQTHITGRYTFNIRGDRILQISGTTNVEAASKVKNHFLYTNGNRMNEIPMGKNEDEAYDNLIKAFNNEFVQTKTKFKEV